MRFTDTGSGQRPHGDRHGYGPVRLAKLDERVGAQVVDRRQRRLEILVLREDVVLRLLLCLALLEQLLVEQLLRVQMSMRVVETKVCEAT